MRILEITYSYKPVRGGADVYADDLRRVLEAAGHEVGVLQRPPAPRDDPAVVAYPAVFGALNAFWGLPWSQLFMARALRRHEVLVCHYPNYALPALWHRRTIGLSHGATWDDTPGSLTSRIKKWWARWAFRRCAKFVANDTFFLREMGLKVEPGTSAFSEVAPGRWFVPNTVDTDVFCPGPQAEEQAKHRPFLLVPRNIYWNRGVHLAVEAFARFAADRPDLSLVVVGGEGQLSAVAAARDAVTRHGLHRRVVFAGSRPRAELVDWYRSAEATLIPSICGEGTSLSALESMACGTPVVGTDVGGLPDLPCAHSRPDAADLASAIQGVLADREAAATRQLDAVHQGFSFARWAEAWRHIVEDW